MRNFLENIRNFLGKIRNVLYTGDKNCHIPVGSPNSETGGDRVFWQWAVGNQKTVDYGLFFEGTKTGGRG